ncbi:Phytocyanin domain containing protein [Trema orientale]|uniref:Phytocyanin domain containing protein n=1 Tax=Trema orientale TaxID=63057 RepID=A0A2P5BRX2_TREOI|nr:Phytocyanin domain containing protein [Trema orientale]
MAQGRVNAMATAALVLLMLVIGHSDLARAATYVVGDSTGGWTFGIVHKWPPKGMIFKAGDTLVFKYGPGHNVVRVSRAGYKSCTARKGARVYNHGIAKIKLVKGKNYFICSVPNHCKKFGLKIAVTAV